MTIWCEVSFQSTSKCDVVKNNICEIFNALLLQARHKSIKIVLEQIRLMVMKMAVDRRRFCKAKFKRKFGPKVWTKIEDNRLITRHCYVEWNGKMGYKFKHIDSRYIIDSV